MYGDFEPPFYHFSKGLGFDEIENLIEKGFFDSTGCGHWTDKHIYKLPPYLKEKYGFINDSRFYTQSQIDWCNEKKFSDIDLAVKNRSEVVERTLVRSQVARGKSKIDLLKCQNKESFDRLNRFNGFTDYDFLDSVLGL